jgi:hypothetical protein
MKWPLAVSLNGPRWPCSPLSLFAARLARQVVLDRKDPPLHGEGPGEFLYVGGLFTLSHYSDA